MPNYIYGGSVVAWTCNEHNCKKYLSCSNDRALRLSIKLHYKQNHKGKKINFDTTWLDEYNLNNDDFKKNCNGGWSKFKAEKYIHVKITQQEFDISL